MPNRKTFDPRERYDHSGRSVEHAERNDLKPEVGESKAVSGDAAAPKAGRRGTPRGPKR